jgi:hypothetical protein
MNGLKFIMSMGISIGSISSPCQTSTTIVKDNHGIINQKKVTVNKYYQPVGPVSAKITLAGDDGRIVKKNIFYTITNKPDSFVLHVWIGNSGLLEAFNIRDTEFLVEKQPTRYVISPGNCSNFTQFQTLEPTEVKEIRFFINSKRNNVIPTYLIFKVHYTDSTNKVAFYFCAISIIPIRIGVELDAIKPSECDKLIEFLKSVHLYPA